MIFLALACAALAKAADIPLQYTTDNAGNLRLGITIGIGADAPKPYLFDTGSSSFNMAYDPDWIPPATSTIAAGLHYLYTGKTHGFLLSEVTQPALTFYTPDGATAVDTINAAGPGFHVAQGTYIVDAALGGIGPVLYTTLGGMQLYEQAAWAQALQNGTPPLYGSFYGIFGAGAFTEDGTQTAFSSVLGQANTSGYVVAANATKAAAALGCGPCVILGLTPALRAQFTLVPWNTSAPSFPVSGANATTEYGVDFGYTLSASNQVTFTWTGPTLLDTGTPQIVLNTTEPITSYITNAGTIIAGSTLAVTTAAAGATSTVITAANANALPPTDVIYAGQGLNSIVGISFFLQNSVLYDLADKMTGYTSNFVTDMPLQTPFAFGPALGRIGLAGVISGSGKLTVTNGGMLTLSALNTYTGPTNIAAGGWLALAGPGSIAASSALNLDGMLDISRSNAGADVTTLAGSGTVALGAQPLTLTAASGSFSGILMDGGIFGGTGGSLIIAGGQELLSGDNVYTGGTAVANGATLALSGTIQNLLVNDGLVENTGTINGTVINARALANNGRIGGSVLDTGLLAGNGSIGGALVVNGRVSPGNGPGNTIGTITVNGNLAFEPGSTYIAGLGAPGTSDLIAGHGAANINGSLVSLVPMQGFSPRIGVAYTVLTSPTITGNFSPDGIYFGTATSLLPFLGTNIANNGSQVNVTLTRSPVPFTALTQTANQRDAANAADTLSANTKLSATLIALPGAQAPAAFTALSGEAYSSIQSTLQTESFYVRDAIDSRLRQTTDPALANATAPQTALLGSHLTLWEQSYGSWGNLSGNSDTASMTSSAGGFMMGLDGTRAGWRTGAAGGVSQSSFSANAVTSSGSSNNYDLAVYIGRGFAGYGPGSLSLHFGGAYSWHDLSARRGVLLPDLQQSFSTNYAARTTQFFGETAYGLTFRTAIRLEPFAGLAYTRLGTDGFSEGPGSAALTAQGNTLNTYESTLGARAAVPFTLGKLPFTFSEALGWQHGFGDLTPATHMQFVAGSQPFNAYGAPLAANAMLLNAGITGRLGHADLTLSYTGQIARAVTQNELNATIGWKF